LTVQQLITLTLEELGVVAGGETPATEESADALLVLNQLIKSWNAQALPIYQLTRTVVVMTGAASYALPARPIKIHSAAVVTATGASEDCPLLDAREWGRIRDKGATGNFAIGMWYDGGFPTGTVWLAPKPNAGNLELYVYTPIAVFATLADTITFPDGYERALRTALCYELAPHYGRQVDPALSNDAKTAVFGLNAAQLGQPGTVAPTAAA
jgi:hypothetical protein